VLGGALIVRRGPWAETVARLARAARASHIHVADDYSACAQQQLAGLGRAAAADRIEVVRHPGVTVVPPGELTPAGGSFFQVFTPYYQRWQPAPLRPVTPDPAGIRLPAGLNPGRVPAVAELTPASPAQDRPRGGESAGLGRLRSFAPAGAIHDPDDVTRRACGYLAAVIEHRAAVAEYRAVRRARRR
jgi:deoxyribodipyrimidine photo-lyase